MSPGAGGEGVDLTVGDMRVRLGKRDVIHSVYIDKSLYGVHSRWTCFVALTPT